MKTFILITSLLAVSLHAIQLDPKTSIKDRVDLNRFAIIVKGKFGFINSSGDVVIPPRFESVQGFSEGLCAVRLGGVYGFIDTDGNFKIHPQYDYATKFSEGLALIYLDGKPQFITPSGRRAFETRYTRMSHFNKGRSTVMTATEKVGIIDASGRLVIDTMFHDIGDFGNGVAVAVSWIDKNLKPRPERKIGIIDTLGRAVVPFGKYESISGPYEGYFTAEFSLKTGDDSQHVIIDTKGELVYLLPASKYEWIDGDVHNGIIRATIRNSRKKNSSNLLKEAYLTTLGNVVYDKRVKYGRDFHENFAFFQNHDEEFSLINRRGEVVANDAYYNVLGEGFYRGKAIVQDKDGWGIIDTTGQFIAKTRFENIHHAGIIDDYFFFEDAATNDSTDYPKYGIADLHGDILVPPMFQFFETSGFVNGLLKTWIDEKLTYITNTGKIVWQQEPWQPHDLQPLNIDFSNRGYFYANYYDTGHGGGGKRSEPAKITVLNSFPGGVLSMQARPDMEYEFGRKIKGMIVFVANATGDTIRFNAQDSRLYMKMQAIDPKGVWRDIEYIPNSWCGNSYHHLDLPENHYWTFVAPVYEGNFPTRLRIELKYVDPAENIKGAVKKIGGLDWSYRNKKELLLYSNEFEGSVNVAQFWRRPTYQANGIMDSYNE